MALSSRGLRALGDVTDYLPLLLKCFEDAWSPSNPQGKIALCLAENKLSFHLLKAKLKELAPAALEEDGVANYGPMRGRPRFRAATARFLSSQLFQGHPVNPDHLTIFNGVGALLDLVAHLLFQEGDIILIPSPYYAAFDNDLVIRAGVRLAPVPFSAPDYELTEELLSAAAAAAEAEASAAGLRSKVAGLLITTPINPLGIVYSEEAMRAAISWCQRRELHFLSDEIYGASCYRSPRYISAADPKLCPDGKLGDRTHIIWGFSKDFCVSGFRVGVLYSQNEQLNKALDNAAIFTGVSHQTQDMLAMLLEDEAFIEGFLAENRAALAKSAAILEENLTKLQIPFLAPTAGMFMWVDLRSLLPAPTKEAEAKLVKDLFDVAGLVFTPGQSQHASEPGLFRICFAYVTVEALEVAIGRLSHFVESQRQALGK